MKRSLFLAIAAIALLALISGCNMNPAGPLEGDQQQASDGLRAQARAMMPAPIDYRSGRDSLSASPMSFANLRNVEYAQWKAAYVVPGDVGLKVQRGWANGNDTVSEGIGYGMLLAYYFNDKPTFDGLWTFSKAHRVIQDSDTTLLMHWRISQANVNISEYGEPVTSDPADHKPIYCLKSDLIDDLNGGVFTYIRHDLATGIPMIIDDPPGVNYLNSLVYEGTGDASLYYTETEKIATGRPNSDFVKIVQYERTLSSAADADFDMAAALCFAAQTWTGGGHDYKADAVTLLEDIRTYDLQDGFIKNGSDWGNNQCWNPSYFSPAWFRVYLTFIYENWSRFSDPWYQYLDIMYAMWNGYRDMELIDSVNANGLFPDWVRTSNGIVEKPVPSGSLQSSDRRYFFTLAQINGGTYDRMQSYNFYYDAVRTPWRLALDYSWYGETTSYNVDDMLREMAVAFPNPATLVDGYSFTGGAWQWNDRDGFNAGQGGLWNSMAFKAMMGCSRMTMTGTGDAAANEAYYAAVAAPAGWADPLKDDYAYYPNTLRLLSLLYTSGYMDNPYAPLGASPSRPIIVKKNVSTDVYFYDGPVWIKIEKSPGWGEWQINNGGQAFSLKIEAQSGSPSENTGTKWYYKPVACQSQTLVKLTKISGADKVVVQCW
jgi:hypothetical protein